MENHERVREALSTVLGTTLVASCLFIHLFTEQILNEYLLCARPRLTARCEGIESSTCKGPRAGVVRPVCPGQREPGTACGAEVSTVGRAGPREEVEGGMQGLVRSVDFIPSLKRDGGGL